MRPVTAPVVAWPPQPGAAGQRRQDLWQAMPALPEPDPIMPRGRPDRHGRSLGTRRCPGTR